MRTRVFGLRTTIGRRAFGTIGLAAAVSAALCLRPPDRLLTPARANGIETIAKDTIYGAGTGLFLGAVTSLVVKEGKRDDTIKWGLVLGTFAGFGYGLYELSDHGFSAMPDHDAPLVIADPARPALGIGQPPLGASSELSFSRAAPRVLGVEAGAQPVATSSAP